MTNPEQKDGPTLAVPAGDETGVLLLGKLGVTTTELVGRPSLLRATFPEGYSYAVDSFPPRVEGPDTTVVIHYDDVYIEFRNKDKS